MSTRRKRSHRGRIISSDEDEENSFINNSDYITPESKAESVNDKISFNEILPFNANGVTVESQASEDDMQSSPSVAGTVVNAGVNPDLSTKELENFEDAESDFHNTTEIKDEPSKSSADDIPKTKVEVLKLDENVSLKPPGSAASSGSRSSSQDLKSTLSYSQQQAEILLQSPSKRREAAASQLAPKKNEPRLVIDKLVLTNFKSYAGRQEIGPFHASFSSVVGPNGSGKSNVIDSMLFVFGFRALKMRQGKLSELIHNSAGGEKLDFCQVDIHFMHVIDDDHDPLKAHKVPDSDMVISRRANKNNSSQYYVNNKASNYTDVTQYLRGQGIDLDHKRFLILQGEVESIAQMKAKAERENDDGLLEYLEDIIGTTKYKQLIENNLTKVDELNDICLEKENRFVLVEKDKDLLEEKKDEALRFLEMEKKLVNKQSIQFQISIHENNKLLHQNEQSVNDLNSELEAEKEKNKELSKEIDEYTKKQDEIKGIISGLDKDLQNLSKKQKSVNKANVTLEEKIKNLSSKTKKLEKSKQLLEHTLSTSKQKLEASNEANLQYKTELEEHTQNLELEKQKLNEMRRKLTDKTAVFTKKIEELQTKLEPWNDKLKDKESAIQLINSSIEMLESQKQSHTNQLNEARQRLIDIKKEGKQKEHEFSSVETKLTRVAEQIQLGEEQCNHQKQKLDGKRSHLSATRQKTQEVISSFSNNQNKNKVLSSLLRLAKSGRINGFYGRLGDLAQIDDAYDTAISTACNALDSMVVETVETAQTCIDYLRKNRLGYANFICLNKLRNFNLAPIQTPGNPATVRRLFDLITPQDPKFLPAFYSKLRDTLVASNLQEARSVAYGANRRFRVVTLDGKLVDTSGTMSGGGNFRAKGGMRLSSNTTSNDGIHTEDEVDEMRRKLNDLETEFDQANNEFQEKVQTLQKLKDMKPELEFTISRLKLDIEALSSEKKDVSQRCKLLIAENENTDTVQKVDEEIRSKVNEREKLEDEKQDLKSQMIDSESQIKELEEKIMEAGGVELRIQNSKVDSIKQKIEIINEKTSNDVMAIKKLENDIKRHTKLIAEAEEEFTVAQKELESAQQFQSEKFSELEELNKKLSDIQQQREEHEENLENIKNDLDERAQKINEFKSVEIEIENKLEKYVAIVKRCKREIEEDKESLQNLVVRDVEPYIDWLNEEDRIKYNGSVIEQLGEEELMRIDQEEVQNDIQELENYMNNVKTDIEVLKEYGVKKLEFESRRNDLNVAVEERDEIKNYCEELKRKRLDEFMEGFNTISMSLKEMYQMITMGGNAELELVDSLDPFSEGILFSVMPPKKSWKNISNLSGGEKTLSSLALVFALHRYKPTPLYVMDEIDAALDFRNVSIVANYIKERTKNAQFVVISLRNNMFELAQQLVGIYKVNNMTRSISLQNKDFLNPGLEESK